MNPSDNGHPQTESPPQQQPNDDSSSLTRFKRFNRWLVKRSENPSDIASTLLHFQPAAVELETAPPNPMAKAVGRVIMLLFVIGFTWALVGKVDVVSIARGQIVPSERVKDIQPLALGQVRTIHVKEGQSVEEGEILVELNAVITGADLTQTQQEIDSLSDQQLRAEHLQAFLEAEQFDDDQHTSAKILEQYQQSIKAAQANTRISNSDLGLWSLKQEIQHYQADQEVIRQQVLSRDAELRMVEQNVASAESALPIVTERLHALETLLNENLVARSQYLELKQEHIEQERVLNVGKENHQQLLFEVAGLKSQLTSMKATRLAELAAERDQLARNIANLHQEMARATERNQQMVLRAPISGTITSLQIHTLGGVVQPAQILMQIVPEEAQLEVEAWVQNKDIGFIDVGLPAEVKVDSFQFTKYGVINAHIQTLSEDAVNDEQQGPIYRTLVSLEKDWMHIDNKQVRLTPGMSVAVEIKTGERRLIEFLMSPLLRYSKESIRER